MGWARKLMENWSFFRYGDNGRELGILFRWGLLNRELVGMVVAIKFDDALKRRSHRSVFRNQCASEFFGGCTGTLSSMKTDIRELFRPISLCVRLPTEPHTLLSNPCNSPEISRPFKDQPVSQKTHSQLRTAFSLLY